MIHWQSTEELKSNEIISFFKKCIESNIHKPSIYKMFSTYISFNSNISGTNKTYRFVIFYPFQMKDEFGTNSEIIPYSSINNIQNIYMKDFCYSVDKSFYEWLYDEMRKTKNIVIAEINDDEISWKISTNKILIYSDNFSILNNNEYFNQTFDEWYENGSFKANFNITIINPYLYSVPFPVKPLLFSFNQSSYGNKLIYIKN